MSKITEEDKIRYNDYLRFRANNDSLRIQEGNKMDNIIITSSIGLIGIAFGFVALVYKEQSFCWLLFSLSIFFACLAIVSSYFSSWCSVNDVLKTNDILDNNYSNGQDIYQTINTNYKPWINRLNCIAMIFLILGISLFFIFVYININIYKKMEDKMDKKSINISIKENAVKTSNVTRPIKLQNGVTLSSPCNKITIGVKTSTPTAKPKPGK